MSICVTGGCGFIGSHIVNILVNKGYKVNITVQSKNAREKESKFWSEKGVDVFEAELTKDGSFRKPFTDVICVIHCAGPFKVTSSNPQKEIYDPIVKGTENVLNECLNSETIKKVIYLSSAAVIRGDDVNHVYNEQDWNKELNEKNPYAHAKYLAERMVWKYQENKKFDVCVLNPSRCIGPLVLKRKDSLSLKTISDLVNGSMKKGCNTRHVSFVNVVDVANVAVLCFESQDVKNERFILSLPTSNNLLEISNMIREKFDNLQLPEKMHGQEDKMFQFDNSKVEKLLKYKLTPLSATVWQAVEAILQK